MRFTRLLPFAAALAACASPDGTADAPLAPTLDLSSSAAVGQVYTMSNQVAGNEVLAFNRAADGSLTPLGSFSTGGTGTGGGLGNQGALVWSSNGQHLFTVNAGSNSISSFAVKPNGRLQLAGTWPSGGMTPVSITVHGGLAYVLNAGGSGNITGFRLQNGQLTMIPGSSRPLSSGAAGAAQVQFARSGTVLIVTEKATNAISTYRVDAAGMATGPRVTASNGQTPFGFGVRERFLVVSEAFGGAPGASAASSYEIGVNGVLRSISPTVGTTQTAACWIAITNDGRFAYTTNTASGTISAFSLQQGVLTLLGNGVTATTDAGPIDLAFSRNSQFIYSLNATAHTITGFAVGPNGALTAVSGGAAGLPVGTNGLAAR